MAIAVALSNIVLAILYDIVLWIFDGIIHTFFREVRSRGLFNIPQKGPVIFVCAPHHNLFIDPVVLMMTSRKHSGRRISLLTAAKTYRLWHIGTVARLCSAIPVERAQDLVKSCKGKIRIENFGPHNDNTVVLGKGTLFTKTAEANGIIGLYGYLGNTKIKLVESDTMLILQKPFPVKFEESTDKDKRAIDALQNGSSYVLGPLIDNRKTFQSVFEHLQKGRALGIFPEGGLHDRTTLLPLKPGVALMALGAVAQSKDPEMEVNIVPVGLNYFLADKFRSSVVIEYGEPITITKKDSLRYESNARDVVSEYLEAITLKLEEVTVTCKDMDTLITIQTARRLYTSQTRDSTSLAMKVEMNRRLIRGYENYADRPEVNKLKTSVADYNKKLMHFGLRDHQVESMAPLNRFSICMKLISRLLKCLLALCLSLPGIIMFSPVFIVATRISKRKAREALASSVVKVKGSDVLASWKILVALGLAPMLYVFWAAIATHLFIKFEFASQKYSGYTFIFCYLLNVAMTYASLRTGEIGYEYFMSLKPLAYSLLLKKKNVLQMDELKMKRKQLSRQVTAFCEKYGPLIFDDYAEFHRHYDPEFAADDNNCDTNQETDQSRVNQRESKFSFKRLVNSPIFSCLEDESDYESSSSKTSIQTENSISNFDRHTALEHNEENTRMRLRKTLNERPEMIERDNRFSGRNI